MNDKIRNLSGLHCAGKRKYRLKGGLVSRVDFDRYSNRWIEDKVLKLARICILRRVGPSTYAIISEREVPKPSPPDHVDLALENMMPNLFLTVNRVEVSGWVLLHMGQ
jgi:hypothetical protein